MSNKPLQYEPLKTVLQFMDPNLRIQLSQRLPSIRLTDKAVPLRIEKLSFECRRVNINGTSYAFSTYRAYPLGSVVPVQHQLENDRGGYPYDLDTFGFGETIHNVAPGDIMIYGMRSLGPPNFRTQEDLERNLALYEKALAKKMERGQADDHVEDITRSIQFNVGIDYTELPQIERERIERGYLDQLHRLSGRCLQYNIDKFKTDLLPYHCRRDNVPAAFTSLIMMRIEKNRVQQHVYRYMYDVKLQAGVRHLCNVIFGRRRHPVEIGTLQIWNSEIIISLPSDLKMKIQNFTIPGDVSTMYESFKNLIHVDSFPLKSLRVTSGIRPRGEYEHDMVKTANRLVVCQNHLDNVLELFLKIRNPIAFFKCDIRNFPVQQQVQLVRNWMESDRRPGTRLSYWICKNNNVPELIHRVNTEFPRVFDEDGTSVIPMQGTNCLQVIYDVNPGWEEYLMPKWKVTLRIKTLQRC